MFKKIIPFILILAILVGFFSPAIDVQAQRGGGAGTTTSPAPTTGGTGGGAGTAGTATSTTPATGTGTTAPVPSVGTSPTGGPNLTPQQQADNQAAFEQNIPGTGCLTLLVGHVEECLIRITYWVLYVLPSALLALTANFFNSIIALTLSSVLYTADFITQGWSIVRDLSNIFFILLLLYAAIQIILDIGHDAKKMIGSILMMALLINFSLFMTKIVIDSSNILALVFYNKMNVETSSSSTGSPTPRPYSSLTSSAKTGVVEKDISGGLVSSFNPTQMMTPEFFNNAKVQTQRSTLGFLTAVGVGAAAGEGVGGLVTGAAYFIPSYSVPDGVMFTIIVVSGLIMAFAAYAFFMAGIAFISRIIELWVLMIFSPFALMSYRVPGLSHVDGIGWDSWLKRLFEVAFMAPIFMFFMYLIFLFLQIPLLSNLATNSIQNQSTYEAILLISMQGLIILILLMKATSYAKKSSGKLGEAVLSGAKLAAGLAIGGAFLGGAAIARGTAGSFMKGAATGDTYAQRLANNDPTLSRRQALQGRLSQVLQIDRAQQWIGGRMNTNQQHAEDARHARHELDEVSGTRYGGKKFDQLTQTERDVVRERVSQNHEGKRRFGKNYNDLTAPRKAAVDRTIAAGLAGRTSHGDHLIQEARTKQGIGNSLMQASAYGSYDPRKIADVVAGEHDRFENKIAKGVISAVASGMRGGLKGIGVNSGTSQKAFFKDLGVTLTEALKNVKLNVDLTHVGEEKKEGHGGGGHH